MATAINDRSSESALASESKVLVLVRFRGLLFLREVNRLMNIHIRLFILELLHLYYAEN